MRTHSVMTRVLSSVAGSALLLALSACGGDSGQAGDDATGEESTSSVAPDAEAADESVSESPETTDEAAEDTDADAEATGGGYDESDLLDAMKAAIAENESAHVTMEVAGEGGQAMTGEGDVSYAGDETAMQMTMQIPQMGGGDMKMRMLDGFLYMAMPPMTPKGKYIKIDTDDPNSPIGGMGGVTTGDPLATFDAFDAGLQEVEYVGAEEVDGEQLDHYVLTVDAKKAAKAQKQEWQKGMPDTLTYDMWLDDSDLMRRIEFDLGAMAGAGSAGGAGGMVMTMSDWGAPVTVEAPPASAIMEMPGGPTS